ncbi:MAG TPA: sugar phosphate nucleotidyltransferase [bacterium]|nr:sugar phosphate nucleotidyltransferase [bacterium]
MASNLAVVILAAGSGKRLGGEKQKVVKNILGKPMLSYLMETVKKLFPDEVIIVVGFKKEEVIKQLEGENVKFAEQVVPLGTGDAVKKAMPLLENFDGNILILYGDVPFISYDTLKNFINDFENSKAMCSIITVSIDNPTGYGRIIRNKEGKITGIVEEVNATPQQKEIKEINSGIYIFKKQLLFDTLEKLKKDPVKGEYYLTDVIKILACQGVKIRSFTIYTPEEVMGINTIEELQKAEKLLKRSEKWTVV